MAPAHAVGTRAALRVNAWRAIRRLNLFFWVLMLSGCSVYAVLDPANSRAFQFKRDTLAFDNELQWKPAAASGDAAKGGAESNDEYTLHCFVMTRSARQFFQFARFDASQPRLDTEAYRRLVRAVIAHDPSEIAGPQAERIVIPGYRDLYSFSQDKEAMLKEELGSAMQSFLQRGNWRMVFPFSHEHQEQTALSLLAEIQRHRPPVVHLATFPNITINHAVLLYGAARTSRTIRYAVYDPNDASAPASLIYDRAKRSFYFPPNHYFPGGEIDVYEIYKSAEY
ncbi:MAG: hypothetical protein ISP90_14395 [Nevskia sp.]|nr:hypothetical protein [Nevskia sp.]